ncbi:MAG: hypothetical protein EOP47_17850 [Sphingobacteriaceae bacterium]|nr:MAG: hypothetical protein EOP47_17850 [Sphingobacteriaceae bacterium]
MRQIIIFISIAISNSLAISQSKTVDDNISKVENGFYIKIDKSDSTVKYNLKERMAFYKVPSVSITVIDNYEISWSKTYGYSDLIAKRVADVNTVYQVASISKSLNALCVMKLYENNQLSLDKDIRSYLKTWRFPDNEFSEDSIITIANLLSHTAGLGTSGFPGYSKNDSLPTINEILDGKRPANSEAVQPLFPPNTKAQYSGGGIFNTSSPVLTNVTISGNMATNGGGGMCNTSSSPVLTNVTISGNKADYGGGIHNSTASSPVLTKATISGNSATNGGGMYNDFSSSPVLTNVTISGNTADYGGGVYNQNNSSPVLTNATISGNKASVNGGGMINNASSSPKINNSIIYNNNTGVFNYDTNSVPVYKNSLVQDNPTGTAMVSYTGAANGTGIFVNPLAPGLNMLGDYSLKAGSPTINMGSNSFFATGQTPDLSGIITDLPGNPRIQKTTIDMGAYESPYNPKTIPNATGIVYVKQNGAGNFTGNSWVNAAPEFADALIAAKNNTTITQIWVAGGTYKPLYSPADNNFGNADGRNNAFLLVNNVKIYGGFAGTEVLLTDRDLTITINKSTLSGDLDNSNTINTNDAYHVAIAADCSRHSRTKRLCHKRGQSRW